MPTEQDDKQEIEVTPEMIEAGVDALLEGVDQMHHAEAESVVQGILERALKARSIERQPNKKL